MSLKEKLEGEPIKEKGDVFVYHHSSILSEETDEERREEIEDRIKKNLCPRCGGNTFEQIGDKVYCRGTEKYMCNMMWTTHEK